MLTLTPLALGQIFSLGLALSLDFDHDGRREQLLSCVEDLVDDRLWVAMPQRAGVFLPLAVGTPVAVQVKREDGLYVLPTRVHGCRLQPCPMLELIPTGAIERHQRRQHARLQLILVPTLAALRNDDGTETRLPATIVNISAGGALVRTRQALEVGRRLHLVVELPPPGGLIDTRAEILRVVVQRAERGAYFEANARFLSPSDSDRDRITRFIFHVQARLARREQADPV